MKFKEFINEAKKVDLIGRTINHAVVTSKTQNEKWRGVFYCDSKGLTTLKGSPREIELDFWCDDNDLTSLKGGPEKVGGDFICNNNKLTSLEGAPKEIGGDLDCSHNPLTTLKDIHKIITKMNGDFKFYGCNTIKSHVLGLLLIPGLIKCYPGPGSNIMWANIVNNYLGRGRAGLIDCQNELIDAGLEEYAQL